MFSEWLLIRGDRHQHHANQLGRRNLSPDAFKLALGRRYNRTKKAAHGRADRDFSEDQIDTPKTNTAAKLAAEHSVSEAAVKRAGKFAEEVAAEWQGLQKSAEPIKPIDTRAELARIAGVSHETYAKQALAGRLFNYPSVNCRRPNALELAFSVVVGNVWMVTI